MSHHDPFNWGGIPLPLPPTMEVENGLSPILLSPWNEGTHFFFHDYDYLDFPYDSQGWRLYSLTKCMRLSRWCLLVDGELVLFFLQAQMKVFASTRGMRPFVPLTPMEMAPLLEVMVFKRQGIKRGDICVHFQCILTTYWSWRHVITFFVGL